MEDIPNSSSSFEGDDRSGDDIWSSSLHDDIFSNDEWPAWIRDESPVRQSASYSLSAHPPAITQRYNSAIISPPIPGPSRSQYNFSGHASHPPFSNPQVHLRQLSTPRPIPTDTRHQAASITSPHSSIASKDSDASQIPWHILNSEDESDYSSRESDRTAPRFRDPLPGSNTQPDSLHSNRDDFVDLTGGTPPRPDMAPRVGEQSNKRQRLSGDQSSQNAQQKKKHKAGASSQNAGIPAVEEVDLIDIEDEKGLSKVLEDQRMATIKAQQQQAAIPVKLATLQCIICMDAMKDVTATSCGHLFCHSCLMEALIAGENQGSEPGRGPSKCPVCRKKVKRPTGAKKDAGQTVSLEIKIKQRGAGDRDKDKAKSTEISATNTSSDRRWKQQPKFSHSVDHGV